MTSRDEGHICLSSRDVPCPTLDVCVTRHQWCEKEVSDIWDGSVRYMGWKCPASETIREHVQINILLIF
jgi:hypothetical protein